MNSTSIGTNLPGRRVEPALLLDLEEFVRLEVHHDLAVTVTAEVREGRPDLVEAQRLPTARTPRRNAGCDRRAAVRALDRRNRAAPRAGPRSAPASHARAPARFAGTRPSGGACQRSDFPCRAAKSSRTHSRP